MKPLKPIKVAYQTYQTHQSGPIEPIIPIIVAYQTYQTYQSGHPNLLKWPIKPTKVAYQTYQSGLSNLSNLSKWPIKPIKPIKIVKKVPVTANSGDYIFDQVMTGNDFGDCSKQTMRTISFELKDVHGNEINLHGNHLSFSIIFSRMNPEI